MKILVCGSRRWSDWWLIFRELKKLSLEATIIHGAAKGADQIAGEIAVGLGFAEVIAVPANWSRHHKAAGHIRNQVMLDMKPDLVLAFHDDPNLGKGTADMVARARRAGVEVKVFIKEVK